MPVAIALWLVILSITSNKILDPERSMMGIADLHIHSHHSWDSVSPVPVVLAFAAQTARLDVVAITDHNQIEGALEAVRLAPNFGVEVVPGCEVSTAAGHLLALFVTQLIPSGLSLKESIERVGDLGGLCVAPHPMAGRASVSLSAQAIETALQHPEAQHILVGIEAYNAGNVGWLFRDGNRRASLLAQKLSLAQLGGSDAHMIPSIGLGKTYFPGRTAADLRQALIQRQTRPVQGSPLTAARVYGHWFIGVILHSTGWTSLASLFGLL